MRTIRTIALSVLLSTSAGCGMFNIDKLKTAVADLDIKGPQTCQLYTTKGVGIAEAAWTHDWPVFAPLADLEAKPEVYEDFCRKVIQDREAQIITKPEGQKHSTALAFVVALSPQYATYTPQRKAATMCHEAAHIVWQHRVGPALAAADYITISGRMSAEAVAYALGDWVYLKLGTTPAEVISMRQRRSERFPKTYKLTRFIEPQCVMDYFTAVSDELQKRTGLTAPAT